MRDASSSSATSRSRRAHRRAPASPAAPALPISRPAPLSARMCATCARLSSGLIGTWTSPARAAASGIRQVSSPLAAQLATRAPGSGTRAASQPASRATRVLKSFQLSVPPRRTSAGASSRPRSARWSSGRGTGSGADGIGRCPWRSGGVTAVSYHDTVNDLQGARRSPRRGPFARAEWFALLENAGAQAARRARPRRRRGASRCRSRDGARRARDADQLVRLHLDRARHRRRRRATRCSRRSRATSPAAPAA